MAFRLRDHSISNGKEYWTYYNENDYYEFTRRCEYGRPNFFIKKDDVEDVAWNRVFFKNGKDVHLDDNEYNDFCDWYYHLPIKVK